MQLTCPACGARYEIDDGLVPPEGRSVQCSVCEHVWREAPGRPPTAARSESSPKPESEGRAGPTPTPGPAPGEPQPQRPPLADEVRAILREEADREARVRRERGLVDIRPDPESASPGAGPRRAPAGPGALPDPDEINQTLRAASQRAAELNRGAVTRPARSGFLAGLVVGLCIVGIAALLYVTAPRIAESVPQSEPALRAYVAAVDDMRAFLDRAVTRAGGAVSQILQ